MNPTDHTMLDALTRLATASDSSEAFRCMDELWVTLGDNIGPYRPLIRAVLERIDEVDRLRSAADRDELTGVGNRRGLQSAVAREMARHRRSGQPLAVLVLDMDGLKRINDEQGHAAGDRAIVELAQACEQHLRESDYLARNGGDEFVVLLPDTDLQGARRVASRLRRAVAERPFPYGVLGASVGCAAMEEGPRSFEDMVQEADAALYRDKRARKEAAAWEPDTGTHKKAPSRDRKAA